MKTKNFNRLALSLTVLAAGTLTPNLYAGWGSIHGSSGGSSHSAPARSAPAPHAEPPRAAQPMRPAEPARPTEPMRPVEQRPPARPENAARPVERPVAHTPAREADARRMDIGANRRQSYFWSDYHAGMRMGHLPDGYRHIGIRGHDFFYFGGVFYDTCPDGYIVVAPPVDADISDLPPGAETVEGPGGTIYYYANGAFYMQQNDGYVVVPAPMGVTVSYLPPDAVASVINGNTYYQAYGVWYQPVFENGVTVYLTVPTDGVMLSLKQFEGRSKALLMAFAVLSVIVIGIGDYVTGYEMTFATFYLFPVAVAVWFVGRTAGMVISFLSVCVWLAGDLANGQHFSNLWILVWNATLTFVFYLIVVWILDKLRRLHAELESRVRQRTIALTLEIQERARLEKELLEVSESEQRKIGHELHDGLGQHLTATAFACQDLAEQLEQNSPTGASAAKHVVKMIEESINLSRTFARGLVPVEVEAEGLMDGFQELADKISRQFKITCEFECRHPVLLPDTAMSNHLYRIAQEAVTNAIKHGKAKKITISLVGDPEAIYLKITNDGAGLPVKPTGEPGLGLRIMAHRANMLGGSFKIESLPGRGARVTCKVPVTATAAQEQNVSA